MYIIKCFSTSGNNVLPYSFQGKQCTDVSEESIAQTVDESVACAAHS
jgi:hypothetical protein